MASQPPAQAFPEGQRRTNRRTGEVQEMRGGQWVTVSAPSGSQQPGAITLVPPSPRAAQRSALDIANTESTIGARQADQARQPTPDEAAVDRALDRQLDELEIAKRERERQAAERMAQLPGGGQANGDQGRFGGFARRARAAHDLYSRLGIGAPPLTRVAAQAVLPEGVVNQFTDEQRQLAEQYQRDFVSAVLRYETGANMPPEEERNVIARYFPQPGDTAATIEAKRLARERAIEGLAAAAGPLGPWSQEQSPTVSTGTPDQFATYDPATGAYTPQFDENGLVIDIQMGGNPETPAPTTEPAGESLPSRLAAAASRGATNLLGAPVDLVNSGLGALGLPVSDTPFLGSRSIANMISAVPNALFGANADIYGPQNAPQSGFEQFGQNALEIAGGGIVPVAGLYGRGASLLGGTPSGGTNALAQGIDRMAIETARRPGAAFASEGGASVGAAGGMSGADAIDPNNALLRATLGTAGGFAGGFSAGMGASRAGRGEMSPEMQAAQRQDIPMMPADVAGPGIRRATSAVAQTAPGAGPIVRAGQATQNAAGAARTRVANQVGSPDTPQAAGEAAIRGGRSFVARTSQEANRLYRRAETQAGDTQVDMANARRVLDQHITELGQTPGGAPGLELLRDLRRELDGAFPVEGIRRMRTQLRDRFEPGSDAARRANQVVDAAAEDVVAALNNAGRPEAARSYQVADRYWRMRMSTIDNALEPILGRNAQTGRLGTRSGEDVVSRIQQAARGRNRQLENFVRALPEDERGIVRGTLINELGRPAAGSPIQGNFSLETFLSNWRQITRNRESLHMVRRLFGNSAVDALEDIATVATASRQANTYANRSNTGGAVGNMATGATAFAGWETLLATVVTQNLSGRLLASPRFARWLARTPRADPNAHIQRLSGIASAEPAIASEVSNLQAALTRAANENTLPAAAASTDERQNRN